MVSKTHYRVDKDSKSNYNVITMKTSIIPIGNSKGIRIPKTILDQTGLSSGKNVELIVKGRNLIIMPAKNTDIKKLFNEEYLLSLGAFKDWDTPEEDEAWAYLQ